MLIAGTFVPIATHFECVSTFFQLCSLSPLQSLITLVTLLLSAFSLKFHCARFCLHRPRHRVIVLSTLFQTRRKCHLNLSNGHITYCQFYKQNLGLQTSGLNPEADDMMKTLFLFQQPLFLFISMLASLSCSKLYQDFWPKYSVTCQTIRNLCHSS